MFSTQTIKTVLAAGIVAVLGTVLVAQPIRVEATNSPMVGKWLVTTGTDSTTASMVTIQGNGEMGTLVVTGRSSVLGPATGEWIRGNGNEYSLKTYAVRSTEFAGVTIQRTKVDVRYDQLTDTWTAIPTYTQYLDMDMNVASAKTGPALRAIRIP
jgi:hypothetical protein